MGAEAPDRRAYRGTSRKIREYRSSILRERRRGWQNSPGCARGADGRRRHPRRQRHLRQQRRCSPSRSSPMSCAPAPRRCRARHFSAPISASAAGSCRRRMAPATRCCSTPVRTVRSFCATAPISEPALDLSPGRHTLHVGREPLAGSEKEPAGADWAHSTRGRVADRARPLRRAGAGICLGLVIETPGTRAFLDAERRFDVSVNPDDRAFHRRRAGGA
jgi:hypothetical protein